VILMKRSGTRFAGAATRLAVAVAVSAGTMFGVVAGTFTVLAVALPAPAMAVVGDQGDDEPGQSGNSLPEGKSLTQMLFDKTPTVIHEAPLKAFPPLPAQSNLLPFQLDNTTSLDFAIDSKSVTIGDDNVIRYTVVIQSPSGGARNIRYEGLYCATGSWRLYSGTNDAGTAWDNSSTPWAPIEGGSMNNYHSTLASNYFCLDRSPVSKVSTIVQGIRYGKSLTAPLYH